MSLTTRLAVLAAIVLSSAPLQASFLSSIGLHNTGAANVHGSADVNYTVRFGASEATAMNASASQAIIRTSPGFPLPPTGPWIPNSTTSSWIGPNNASTHTPGFYVYETKFNLTGYQTNQVAIGGQFSVDNRITKVLLNGQVVPGVNYLPPINVVDGQLYRNWKAFALPAGSAFLSGLNSLVFVTENLTGNTGNPTGLRVEYLAQASSAPLIPEPTSALLFTLGAPVVGLTLRRRFC